MTEIRTYIDSAKTLLQSDVKFFEVARDQVLQGIASGVEGGAFGEETIASLKSKVVAAQEPAEIFQCLAQLESVLSGSRVSNGLLFVLLLVVTCLTWGTGYFVARDAIKRSSVSNPSALQSLAGVPVRFASAGWGSPKAGFSVGGNILSVGGKRFPIGVGTHAPSEIVLAVDKQYRRFAGGCGIDDETNGLGSASCKIYLDGKIAWESGVILAKQPPRMFSVDTVGVSELSLVVEVVGGEVDRAHVDWVNLAFE